jgi:PhzF family phenazine biosynthesis protein
LRILQIDAFTSEPFRGNPAAVCFLDRERDSEWMQRVAAEMNLSETAFLLRHRSNWSLRWFTPVAEVDLCGHATLASAHALWEGEILHPSEQARFETRSGLLTAIREGDLIELDFPVAHVKSVTPPAGLLEALGVTAASFGQARDDYFVEIATPEEVRSLKPDLKTLAAMTERGIIVTSRSDDPRFDFISRFFAPAVGIDEDPVTGSAHCSLAAFWTARLGKQELQAWQASSRGGAVRVRLDGERVKIGGRAVTVLRGELTV